MAENGVPLTNDVYSELMMIRRYQEGTVVSQPMKMLNKPKRYNSFIDNLVICLDYAKPHLLQTVSDLALIAGCEINLKICVSSTKTIMV